MNDGCLIGAHLGPTTPFIHTGKLKIISDNHFRLAFAELPIGLQLCLD
jgi:hypothetical protein